MAQLYLTSPINNDTLYRPVTVETNTSNPLADSIDNHHGSQVIIADSSDTEVVIADKNDSEVVIADKNDPEMIIAAKNATEVVAADKNVTEVMIADKNDTEVVIADKNVAKVVVADKNEKSNKVEKHDVGRGNSIEIVKTVSVPSGICEQTKDKLQITDAEIMNSSDKSELFGQQPPENSPNITSSEKSEVTEVKLPETSDCSGVKPQEKSEDRAVRVTDVSALTPDSASQSDALTAAAEKVNEVLLSESNNFSSSVKPNVANDIKKSEIVVIPDESPTNHQPQLTSHVPISLPSISASSQVPTIQPHTSANISLATLQQLNPAVTSRSNSKPPVIASDPSNPAAVQPMTSQQQSIIQKLIPSLINLNKSVGPPVHSNPLHSMAPSSATSSSTPPSVPALIPAASSRTTSGSAAGSGGSGFGGGGSAKSNGVITIDDDDDLVVTQVIKPAGSASAPPPSTRNDSLLQLVSKIKSMVEPNAASQPKLKQLQQTLASLIKNQGLSRNTATPQHQQQASTAASAQRLNYPQQVQQTSTAAARTGFQHQGVIQNVSTPQRKGTQPQQIPQRQLQALLQQAIANRTQAQQQAVQQHTTTLPKPHASHQQQQQQMRANASSSGAGLTGASNNVLQQLLQAVMSKQPQQPQQQQQQQQQQQHQQQQQQVLKQQYLPQKPRATAAGSPHNHASQTQNQHLMLIENALKGSNPNLAANLKTLQDQLKAKSSNPADIKNELTAIISNVLRLRNSQQQMENTSPKPLKSPSLRRQIQTAHRPKLNTTPHANKPGPSHIQQLRKPVRAPTIDLLQNLPVVHHSKEKVQFLGVVGLITRQEHQRLIISHANRKRRIEEARNILQLEKVSFERKRKRPRKDDMDNDGDTHDNYCGKCRMAGELLMCDKCPRVYHLFCLDPPLKQVPDGEWFCSKCQEEKDAEESMDVNVIDVMEDPAVDQESREQIEELHRKLMEAKRVRLDLENTTDIT